MVIGPSSRRASRRLTEERSPQGGGRPCHHTLMAGTRASKLYTVIEQGQLGLQARWRLKLGHVAASHHIQMLSSRLCLRPMRSAKLYPTLLPGISGNPSCAFPP